MVESNAEQKNKINAKKLKLKIECYEPAFANTKYKHNVNIANWFQQKYSKIKKEQIFIYEIDRRAKERGCVQRMLTETDHIDTNTLFDYL